MWQMITYQGHPISFSDLCILFQNTEEALINTWENRVLQGLTIRVEYSSIHVADDFTNKEVGYSFLSDPCNKHCQNITRLVDAVVDVEGGFADFLLYHN
jgi:hypothetical protein